MDSSECCPICLDDITSIDRFKTIICSHTFHPRCLRGIYSESCPLCRRYIGKDLAILTKNHRDPFMWDAQQNLYVYPSDKLSSEEIYRIMSSLERDLKIAILLEQDDDVINKRVRRLDSVFLYYCLNC